MGPPEGTFSRETIQSGYQGPVGQGKEGRPGENKVPIGPRGVLGAGVPCSWGHNELQPLAENHEPSGSASGRMAHRTPAP